MSQEEPYGPLRRDVRMLGSLLGRVLVEQEGAEFLAAEERIRASARLSREIGDPAPVREALGALPPEEQSAHAPGVRSLLPACEHGRAASPDQATARVCDRAPGAARVARGGLRTACRGARGRAPAAARRRLAPARAHRPSHGGDPKDAPAGARADRDDLLARQDDPELTAAERAELEGELTEEITILWQTDEVRADRPRVGDEIRHGLWFFEESLFDAGERLLREYRRLAPGTRPPFSFGSWIGGDTDGNPEVNAQTITAALERARESALSRYRADVRALSIAVSSSGSLVGISAELADSLAARRPRMPRYRDDVVQMMSSEHYRRKLSYMWWRLGNDGYPGPDALREDIAIVKRSLEANRGARIAHGAIDALDRRVELFGFHLAKLDVRLHASEVRDPTERTREVFEAVSTPASATARRRSTR